MLLHGRPPLGLQPHGLVVAVLAVYSNKRDDRGSRTAATGRTGGIAVSLNCTAQVEQQRSCARLIRPIMAMSNPKVYV